MMISVIAQEFLHELTFIPKITSHDIEKLREIFYRLILCKFSSGNEEKFFSDFLHF